MIDKINDLKKRKEEILLKIKSYPDFKAVYIAPKGFHYYVRYLDFVWSNLEKFDNERPPGKDDFLKDFFKEKKDMGSIELELYIWTDRSKHFDEYEKLMRPKFLHEYPQE